MFGNNLRKTRTKNLDSQDDKFAKLMSLDKKIHLIVLDSSMPLNASKLTRLNRIKEFDASYH